MASAHQPEVNTDPNRWALAVACTNDGVWDWDLRRNQVFYSDRWKSMLGYAPEEVGTGLEEWRSRVHPDDLARVMQDIRHHFDGQTEYYQNEHRMRHKDGHDVWILDRGQAQRDARGQVVRMTGFHTDVTERYLAQAAVENLSQERATILQLSPDGFVAFDEHQRVKYVTDAFVGMTGLTAAQLQGLEEEQFWAFLAQRCLAQSRVGHVATVRHNLSLPNNQRRNLLELTEPAGRTLLVTQRDSRGGSIYRILCFRDVSCETEVDRLKSEFMATAAHELRTPLASIYGFAEILLTDEVEVGIRREFTDIIYLQSQTMTHLLNEMLDLARIEARRRTDFVFTHISARQLVQQVLGGFKPPVGRDAVVLQADQADWQVRVDVKKASQVLLNVLTNAYKYSPEGGAVQIGIERTTPVGLPPEVVIHITDHGMGMTPDQLERVFERFYRANPTSRIPGTGLGMSIVKEIMTLLEGRVELVSRPGQGTRVSLVFPDAQGL
jgi:PAS domain S-box-containing protein